MQIQSIVPVHKIQKDPRNFAFLFPSMPLRKYKDATDQWYKWKAIKALEEVAAMAGKYVLPATCVHWSRKKKLHHRRVELHGRSYYILSKQEMSKTEKKRYADSIVSEEL